jgi:hypothetical protein
MSEGSTMSSRTIKEGQTLGCTTCGYTRRVTEKWLQEACKTHFHRNHPLALYPTDLTRFRCSNCGSKTVKHISDAFGEKRQFYEAIGVDELRDIWRREANKETSVLEDLDRALIRDVLRHKLDIKDADGHAPSVCPECGMVTDNCTCGRSWF